MRKPTQSQRLALASVLVLVLAGVLCTGMQPQPTPFAAYVIGEIAPLNVVELLQRARQGRVRQTGCGKIPQEQRPSRRPPAL